MNESTSPNAQPPLRELAQSRASLEAALQTLGPECNYRPAALARRLGVSHRHLQRVFSRLLDTTPRTWLGGQRMERASQLLRTAGSVKEVAFALGFRHLAQFSRDFKGHHGLQPSALLPRPSATPSVDASTPTSTSPDASIPTCPSSDDHARSCSAASRDASPAIAPTVASRYPATSREAPRQAFA